MRLIFRTLDALRIFDLPYVLTEGRQRDDDAVADSTQTFAENRIYGLGAAYSILTFITVMIVSFIYIWTSWAATSAGWRRTAMSTLLQRRRPGPPRPAYQGQAAGRGTGQRPVVWVSPSR